MIARRSFLAAAPFVFGLDRLLAQAQEPAAPAWYQAALQRMKDTRRLGLVLVVNTGDVELGARLLDCLKPGPAGEILGQAVLITIVRPLARDRVLRPGETFDRVLLDPDGRRLEADYAPPGAFVSPEAFAQAFRPLVEGVDGARLRARAVETPELRALVEKLDAEDADVRQAASTELARQADRHYPWLLWSSRQPGSTERRARLAEALQDWQADRAAGRLVPYGTAPLQGAVMNPRAMDPCPGCGLGSVTERSRRFLKFLEK